MQTQLNCLRNHHYQLVGHCDMSAVALLEKSAKTQFSELSPQTLCLQAVTGGDSSLLALMIEWKKSYPQLEYKNIPPFIYSLANIYQMPMDWLIKL